MKQLTLPNGQKICYIDKLTARYVYNEIFAEKEYMQHGITIKEGDTIFDVGANIGLFTRFAAEQASRLEIYTFEPVPIIFRALEENLKDVPATVKNYNAGLGDATREVEITYYPKVCADSAIVPFDWDYKLDKYVEQYKEAVCADMPIARIVPRRWRCRVVKSFLKRIYSGEPVTVQIRTLSDVIAENKVNHIDLLKIDAENYETQVLAGISEGDWEKIQQIAMEVHTHIPGGRNLLNDLRELLHEKGFETHLGRESRESILGVYMLFALK